MMHPSTELRFVDQRIGYGVFATQPIPRGTITWVRDDLDRGFTREAIDAMEAPYREILEKYTFVDAQGAYVLCWDIARFVNHSCDPTCLAPGYDFELAVRDVAKGEELTDDYGSLNIQSLLECRCGSARCRRDVRQGDLLRHADEWDALVAGAFRGIGSVAQPLWPFVKDKTEIERLLREAGPPPSCRRNYWQAR
jgi:hypothetical protein